MSSKLTMVCPLPFLTHLAVLSRGAISYFRSGKSEITVWLLVQSLNLCANCTGNRKNCPNWSFGTIFLNFSLCSQFGIPLILPTMQILQKSKVMNN